MAPSLPRPLRRIHTTWHKFAGRVLYGLGRREAARGHFERVLQLGGDDFIAYFMLGRIAQRAGDLETFQREMENARRTSPRRFARSGAPNTPLFDAVPLSEIRRETDQRATWEAPSMTRVMDDEFAQAASGTASCRGGNLRRFGDDFSSGRERQHFSKLPPICAEDLAEVDIDKLADNF